VHRVGGQLLPVVRFNIRLPARPSACIGSQFCLKTVGWRIIVKYDMGSLGGDDLAGSRGVEEGADKGLGRTYLLFLEWLPRD